MRELLIVLTAAQVGVLLIKLEFCGSLGHVSGRAMISCPLTGIGLVGVMAMVKVAVLPTVAPPASTEQAE